MEELKEITIIGWYGMSNIGDDAFQSVFNQELAPQYRLLFENTDVIFTKSPTVIYGGGGVISVDRMLNWKKQKKKNKIAFACGVDVPTNGEVFEELKDAGLTKLYCRSKEYQWLLKDALPIEYCPDLVFAYNFKQPTATARAKKVLGIICTHELKMEEHIQKHIVDALNLLSDEFEIKFISFYAALSNTEFSDATFNKKIAEQGAFTYSSVEPVDVDAAFAEIAGCDYLWSMRFHGLIFATMLGVPVLSLANKGKCSQFCEQELLHKHYVELKEITPYKLLNSIETLRGSKDSLLQVAYKNNKEVKRMFKELLAVMATYEQS